MNYERKRLKALNSNEDTGHPNALLGPASGFFGRPDVPAYRLILTEKISKYCGLDLTE
jgi:hypothetical protein